MRLACITIPNFRIALERRRDGSLCDRPFAIGEPPPGANTVVECSPEAAALGVRAGMPLRDARTLAPDLTLLPPDPVYYSRSYDALLLALEDAEPLIEPADNGTAFAAIDTNASEAEEWQAASRLVHAVNATAGIDATAGIAEGKFVAYVAAAISPPAHLTRPQEVRLPSACHPERSEGSHREPAPPSIARPSDLRHPPGSRSPSPSQWRGGQGVRFSERSIEKMSGDGSNAQRLSCKNGDRFPSCVVPPGNEQAFLAPLSTSFLPVSFDAQRKLTLYALRTIGDVARLDIGPLQAQFGREGRRLWELARGIDTSPFLPRDRNEPVTGTIVMPAPTVNTGALIIGARQLVGRLLQHPRMRYRQVRMFRLRLAQLDGGSWERALTFREPLGDEDSMVYVVKKLIEPLQLAGPVEEMTLEFVELTGETGKQRSLLFAEQARRHAQLITALRQLKTRFGGDSQVARVVEVEPWSRIPERRYALIDYDL